MSQYLFQIIESLRTLLKYDIATFEPSVNQLVAEYKLLPENALLLIRYPRSNICLIYYIYCKYFCQVVTLKLSNQFSLFFFMCVTGILKTG